MEFIIGGLLAVLGVAYVLSVFKLNLHSNPFIRPEWEDPIVNDEEEVIDPEDTILKSREDLQKMTKAEIESYAHNFGIELDRRKKKDSMIETFIENR